MLFVKYAMFYYLEAVLIPFLKEIIIFSFQCPIYLSIYVFFVALHIDDAGATCALRSTEWDEQTIISEFDSY